MTRFLLLLFLTLGVATQTAYAAEDICKLKAADIEAAIAEAMKASLDPTGEVQEAGPFQGIWGNSTCTGIYTPKKGKDAKGTRSVSLVYIQWKSAADYAIETKVVPIQPDGSFTFAGTGTEKCIGKEMRFIPQTSGLLADCGQFKKLLEKK